MSHCIRYLFTIITAMGLLAACTGRTGNAGDPDLYYTCSMDPQVVEPAPGKCPVCGMPLTAVKKVQMEKAGELKLSDQQIRLGNIKTAEAALEEISEETILNGAVGINENRAVAVTARTMGRIVRLYVRNPGEHIRKGDPLFRIYSEEIALAVKELLLTKEKAESLPPGQGTAQLLESARKKLEVLGLDRSQAESIEKNRMAADEFDFLSPASGIVTSVEAREGAFIMTGTEIFRLADLSTVWIQTLMYPQDVRAMRSGIPASITYPSIPGRMDKGNVTFIAPELGSSSILTSGRIEVQNAGGRLLPGMQAIVAVKGTITEALVVPTDAIITDSKGSRLWVSAGPNSFRHVMVETGVQTGARTAILSGLKEGEEVVISGAYLLNSEYVFKKGSDPMATHQH